MSFKRFLGKCVPVLAICPFVIGTLGYRSSGEKLSDALYASFALYFVNPVSDAYNIPIEIARWTAALVTTSAILYAVRRIWIRLSQALCCLGKDSIAVYSDEDVNIVFDKPKRSVIYPGREFNPLAKSHIIMLNSDTESLKFYRENIKAIKKSKVYIALREMNYGFTKELSDKANIYFFDIDGAAARTLWKQIALWKDPKPRVEITILGTDHLGQSVLNYGLQLNLYSLSQEIVYNFIGSDKSHQTLHGGIPLFCRDRVNYLKPDDDSNAEIIKKSDIVIVCGKVSVVEFQTIAGLCGGVIYCYSHPDSDMADFLNFPRLKSFGKNSEIYTDANIRRNDLVADAMELHYSYLKQYGNGEISDIRAEWNKLNGFLKTSNISSADYIPILKTLWASRTKGDEYIEELAELEHIRWCRFHFLNLWRFGVPENGKNRDNDKKIHILLRPFSELPPDEREKNIETVRKALEMSHDNKMP